MRNLRIYGKRPRQRGRSHQEAGHHDAQEWRHSRKGEKENDAVTETAAIRHGRCRIYARGENRKPGHRLSWNAGIFEPRNPHDTCSYSLVAGSSYAIGILHGLGRFRYKWGIRREGKDLDFTPNRRRRDRHIHGAHQFRKGIDYYTSIRYAACWRLADSWFSSSSHEDDAG